MNPPADNPAEPRASDVATPAAIVAALYEAISFPPGGRPDWERLRTLFLADARLIPPQVSNPPVRRVADFETWMTESDRFLEASDLRRVGFRERELASRVEQFGDLAHVFSSYAGERADESVVTGRGINSIQLVRHAGRWWVATIVWDIERPDRPIPGEYL